MTGTGDGSEAPGAPGVQDTVDADVIIVGAGLSGIGAACRLRRHCPDRHFLVLEARADLGGTWDLFRYPGVRSDSDMHTLGFPFRPWREPQAIAEGPAILAYLRETVEAFGLEPHLRFRTRVLGAAWCSTDARWSLTIETGDGLRGTLTCRFLHVCSGYYDYDRGHEPDIPDRALYGGTVVHPQFWPDDLDCKGKRVLVIGSGATAVTLVPALAGSAAHVTLLQRTPTWMGIRPREDRIANALYRRLPERLAHTLVRSKNVLLGAWFYRLTRRRPERVRRFLLDRVRKALGPDVDPERIERDFTPPYDPWDQRLCLVPDGDLFAALRHGRASVLTDRIEAFTERGLRLASGRELDADVMVTATGLELKALGGLRLRVDGQEVHVPDTIGWKGLMLSDVPNLAMTFGYVNASWTLRADLVARYVCRLLNHMRRHGHVRVVPRVPRDGVGAPRPWIELDSGYVRRGGARFPRQGSRGPWRHAPSYLRDLLALRLAPLGHPALEFSGREPCAAPATTRTDP